MAPSTRVAQGLKRAHDDDTPLIVATMPPFHNLQKSKPYHQQSNEEEETLFLHLGAPEH
jgi:hypothetical protein